MTNRVLFLVAIQVFCFYAFGQLSKYQVLVDLSSATDDQVKVTYTFENIDKDTILFSMPKVVPGTYSISDFGRFINRIDARDIEGNPLQVKRVNTNQWQIIPGKRLNSLSYWVHDTFDKFEEYSENYIFEPGGSGFDADRQVFVINNFALVGYIDDQTALPYTIHFRKPEVLYGATSLTSQNRSPRQDSFIASTYHELIDHPILYCKADTASLQVANTKVMVAVYSPGKKISSKEIVQHIADLKQAQASYLGGTLPVDRYSYLVYLESGNTLSDAMGALEHNYSSLYVLPDGNLKQLGQTIRDVAAHEFFHIVTPLNIHSEQIHYFNYQAPAMSRHLWLYEGVTEYNSMLVQVQYGLTSRTHFLNELTEKIDIADSYPLTSFTEMSKRILEPDFQDLYTNVYYKGALIALGLDLHLLKFHNINVVDLLMKLAEKYGKDKPFEDVKLIDEITAMTGPEVGNYLKRFVEGEEELPILDILAWVGIEQGPAKEMEISSLGKIGIGIGPEGDLVVSDISEMNEFGRAIGYQEGDKIIKLAGKPFTSENFMGAMEKLQSLKAGKKVEIVLERKVNGVPTQLKRQAKVLKVMTITPGELTYLTNPPSDVLNLREKWLTPKKS